VTNAQIGTERLSPIPDRTPAIKLWNQIHAGELMTDQQTAALAGVRTLLSKAKKPEGLNDQTWATFADFITGATADDLLQFIRRVEWKTQAATAGSLRNAIKQALIDRHNASPEAAQAIYERLFFYVFNLLANAGRKRLGIDDLQIQLGLPALSAADQRLSENLTILLSEIETRVAALEEDLKLQQQSIQQMDSQLQSLTLQVGANVAVDYAFGSAQTGPSPISRPHRQEAGGSFPIHRTTAVENLVRSAWRGGPRQELPVATHRRRRPKSRLDPPGRIGWRSGLPSD
jgi:hypothetical protein